ncbi:type III secretion system translocon subunit SctE [Proteus columbae]|uniref:type III secretion system translocon subunit SctE n=1 Tax=Proteus columbae TaxID=1987580 RepID=UPI00288A138E|nr:type III secretion system translocon subunit SctE [Proteus columbae]
MNDINKVNDKIIFSTPLPSKEVENVIKNTTQQAQRINIVNENIVSSQIKDKENKFYTPILRAPVEQEKNSKRINLEDEGKYGKKVFPYQNIKSNDKDIQHQNKNDKLNIPQDKIGSSTFSAPSQSENKKSNQDYDFLFLQLSYQNIIHQNVLDRIKDPDKLDFYIGKLEQLSKGIDGLREQFKPILNEIKNTKGAYVDYWMDVYNQIKDKGLKTPAEVRDFLKNNNIPNSLIKKLLAGNIQSKEEMGKLLEKTYPFLILSDDLSKLPLDDLNKLYLQLSNFFNDAVKSMPNISISEDKINKITAHKDELKALINKKENESIKTQLEQAYETYKALTNTQSALEIKIMSDSLSGMALLTFLLAKTRELTLNVMLQRAQNEQKLFEEIQDASMKILEEKIEDQKAQIKKQEEIQIWAKRGLFLLSILLMAVSVIASVVTGGASLALMGVAVALLAVDVALTVADKVYQEIHGESFMDELMKPITDAVMAAIDKIVEVIADVLKDVMDVLKELGLDKKFVEDIKNAMQDKLKMALKIAITVILFVAAIALSFVVGPAANGISNIAKKLINQQVKGMLKKVLNDALEVMLGRMIKEIIIQAFEEAMAKITKLLTKELTQKAGVMLNRIVVVSKLTNAAATNAVNIYSSIISAKILQSMADSKKLEAILALTQKLMDKIMESYNENVDTITEILKNMSENSSVSNKAKSDMIRSISI